MKPIGENEANPAQDLVDQIVSAADHLIDKRDDAQVAILAIVEQPIGTYFAGTAHNESVLGNLHFAYSCLKKAAEGHADGCALGAKVAALAVEVGSVLEIDEADEGAAIDHTLSSEDARPSDVLTTFGEKLPLDCNALLDVMLERARQVVYEGFTPDHDDKHQHGEIALAAAAYAYGSQYHRLDRDAGARPSWWPWDMRWWKPHNPRRDLIKAAALILAEIARLDRSAAKEGGAA